MAKYPPPGTPGFSIPSMDPEAIKRRKEIYQQAMETQKREREEDREQETLQSRKRVRKASNASMHSIPFTNLNKSASSHNDSSTKEEPLEEAAAQSNRPMSFKTLPSAIPVKQKNNTRHKRELIRTFGHALSNIAQVWIEKAETMTGPELDAVLGLAFPSINEPEPARRVGRPKKTKEEAKEFAAKLLEPLEKVLGPMGMEGEQDEEQEAEGV